MSPRHFTRWPVAEGYAARQSVVAGDPVDLHCSSRVPDVDVEVADSGHAREVVWRSTASVGDHPVPDDAWRAGATGRSRSTIPTDASWRPGLYEIELRTGDGPQDVSQAFVVVRHPGPDRPRRCCTSAPTRGRRTTSGAASVCTAAPRRCRSGDRSRSDTSPRPVDDDGYDLPRRQHRRVRPEHHRFAQYLAEHEIPLWTGSARLVQLGAPACRVGRPRGHRARLRRRRRPRSGSERARRPEAAAHRRPQRVLVVGDARCGRPLRRGRRQLGDPLRQHELLAGALLRRARVDDLLQGRRPQRRSGARHGSAAHADELLVRSADRPAGDHDDRLVVHSRRLLPRRGGRPAWHRGVHHPAAGSLGVRRHRPPVRRRGRGSGDRRRIRGRRLRVGARRRRAAADGRGRRPPRSRCSPWRRHI